MNENKPKRGRKHRMRRNMLKTGGKGNLQHYNK